MPPTTPPTQRDKNPLKPPACAAEAVGALVKVRVGLSSETPGSSGARTIGMTAGIGVGARARAVEPDTTRGRKTGTGVSATGGAGEAVGLRLPGPARWLPVLRPAQRACRDGCNVLHLPACRSSGCRDDRRALHFRSRAGRRKRCDRHHPLERIEPAGDRRHRPPAIGHVAVRGPGRIERGAHRAQGPGARGALVVVFAAFDLRHQQRDALRRRIDQRCQRRACPRNSRASAATRAMPSAPSG